MKAAEAAFKDSVDVWEGGTDTELGCGLTRRLAAPVSNSASRPVRP